ncbi:hypothetical protein SAMN05216167_102715 [Spirosoma endophyticum]|uniref:Uncharacterized protein n=1 Tax=Spirosoma endophyticum TaxID=662367 RepID=A0A1I1MV72_9BACT|nr:hypothetical protein SAMN05216167_102715 [Spirosoma endophyticum]
MPSVKTKLSVKVPKIDPLSVVLAISILASSYLVYKQKQKVDVKTGIVDNKAKG